MRNGLVRFDAPGPNGNETVFFYYVDSDTYTAIVGFLGESASEFETLFDNFFNADGLHYCPADEFKESDLFSVLMGDEDLKNLFGYAPFAKSNMPAEIVG